MVSGRRIEYADFAVRIAPDGAGGYVSEVVFAPAGGGSRAPFVPPFAEVEIPVLLGDLQRALHGRTRRRSRHLEAPVRCSSRRYDPAEVGTLLFRALFQGEVGLAFARARPRPGDPRLRIRLLINPLRADSAAIAALPWELLHDPDGDGFLTSRSHFAVVRYLEGTDAHKPLPLTGDLRVLAAFCAPGNLPRLECAAERAALQRWAAIPGVQVSFLERASFDEARERLRDEVFHVFHFSGHGGFAGGRGTLAFERADGTAEAIGAEILTATFDEAPALRLAVINACDSGKAPRVPGADPYRGVASALIRSAVPAVIGMQFAISDRAAACFAETLYASLAHGDPVDAAVTRGRLEILRNRGSLEWATPALHLRVPDGRLFERTEPPPPLPLPLLSAPPAPHRRRRWLVATGALVLLVALGWGAWRLTRPAAPEMQPPAAGLEARPPDHHARDSRVAPDWACPPHELLPGFEWILIEPGVLELLAEEPDSTRLLLIEKAFCIGRREVTWTQRRSVLGEDETEGEKPPAGELPAFGMSWDLSLQFLEKLNERFPDRIYRLPTGAEWEFAARGGSKGRYSFGDDQLELYRHGNCRSSGGTNDGFENDFAPVGTYQANALGLYDVHGNVWEWVSDPPGSDYDERHHVRRGGSYASKPEKCTISASAFVQGRIRHRDSGLRIVLELTRAPIGAGRRRRRPPARPS